jgi:hypothetical protein
VKGKEILEPNKGALCLEHLVWVVVVMALPFENETLIVQTNMHTDEQI